MQQIVCQIQGHIYQRNLRGRLIIKTLLNFEMK